MVWDTAATWEKLDQGIPTWDTVMAAWDNPDTATMWSIPFPDITNWDTPILDITMWDIPILDMAVWDTPIWDTVARDIQCLMEFQETDMATTEAMEDSIM